MNATKSQVIFVNRVLIRGTTRSPSTTGRLPPGIKLQGWRKWNTIDFPMPWLRPHAGPVCAQLEFLLHQRKWGGKAHSATQPPAASRADATSALGMRCLSPTMAGHRQRQARFLSPASAAVLPGQGQPRTKGAPTWSHSECASSLLALRRLGLLIKSDLASRNVRCDGQTCKTAPNERFDRDLAPARHPLVIPRKTRVRHLVT